MNICFMVYDLKEIGGLNTVVLNLSNEFSKDNNINVFILDLNPKHQWEKNKLLSAINYSTLALPHYHYPIQFFLNLRPIYSYLKQKKIDVALIEGTDAGFFAPILQPFISTKFIFCDHGALCNQVDNKKVTLIRYMASRLCRHTVVLTKKTYNDYIQIFKIKKEKLSVVYNYAECALSEKYDIDAKKIMSIGRLTNEKGMNLLLDVANIVLKRASGWSWDIYGTGPLLNELKDKTRKLNLEEQLHFLGEVEGASSHMPEYGIYVLPSYREGLPLVLIEAVRNRLPIVSFDIDTGPRDIIVNGENGYLVQPYDVKEMAEKVLFLIESDNVRKKYSQNCERSLQNFVKAGIISQWKDLLKVLS